MSLHPLLRKHVAITELDAIKQISAPLKSLGVEGLFLVRHLPGNSFIDLGSVGDWTEYFLTHYLDSVYDPKSIQEHLFVTPFVSLWALNPGNSLWQEGAEIFNYGNGITLKFEREGYTDVLGLFAKKCNRSINEFYINNIDCLEKIYAYFIEKAQPILEKGERNPLIVPEKYRNVGILHPIKNNFEEINSTVLGFSKAINLGMNANVYLEKLSPREVRCAQMCSQGKTAKEIARVLMISHRTVEAHLNNAKAKLNCSNLKGLVAEIVRTSFDA